MPNHPSVIARPTETGFAGRYVHNNGHPATRIPLLRALYAGPFAGDLDAMTKFLIDDHPAGWSQLGLDPAVDTGWNDERSSVYHHDFVCYCHGDRNEDPWLCTEENTDIGNTDWVYVLRSDGIEVIDLGDGATTTTSWEANPDDNLWEGAGDDPTGPFYEPARAEVIPFMGGQQVAVTFYDGEDQYLAGAGLTTDAAEKFAQALLAAVKEGREEQAAYTYTSDQLPSA